MPRSTAEHPEKSREPNLLQEFENSLPDFKNLDEEQHRKFVRAIRCCAVLDISEARLRNDHFFKFKSTIARLSELYEEYHDKDAILASAILFVKLHIESNYLYVQDANLVHNLTALHIYPRVPLDCAPGSSLRRYSRKRAPQGWGPGCRGRYRVERLMAEHCDAKLRDLLQTLADCPKVRSLSIHDRSRLPSRASSSPSKRTMRLSNGRLCGDGGSGGLRRVARRRRSKRSGIGLMEEPRSRSVADPGWYIRTPEPSERSGHSILAPGKATLRS